jgi:hypothetical protein
MDQADRCSLQSKLHALLEVQIQDGDMIECRWQSGAADKLAS